MTATELQNIANVLANQCFVRYWLNFNLATGDQQLQMAICCRDEKDTIAFDALLEKGFAKIWRGMLIYYVIDRTNNDGTPYFSAFG